jgi:hypothetical protein
MRDSATLRSDHHLRAFRPSAKPPGSFATGTVRSSYGSLPFALRRGSLKCCDEVVCAEPSPAPCCGSGEQCNLVTNLVFETSILTIYR